jgi:hypothetical protein
MLRLHFVALSMTFYFALNNQQPTTNNQQPTTNNQQPTTRYSRSQRSMWGKPAVVVIPIHTSRGRPT